MQKNDTYKNILVIVTGLLIFSWIFKLDILWKIAAIVGIASALFSFVARWIEWGWLKLALALGWINSRILLSIIYYLFLFPIALVSRLFRKDPLMIKGNQTKSTYALRDHLYTKKDLENIW